MQNNPEVKWNTKSILVISWKVIHTRLNTENEISYHTAHWLSLQLPLHHKHATFHYVYYPRSRPVLFRVKSNVDTISTRLKQRAVIQFLSTENVTPTAIRRLAVYDEEAYWAQIHQLIKIERRVTKKSLNRIEILCDYFFLGKVMEVVSIIII